MTPKSDNLIIALENINRSLQSIHKAIIADSEHWMLDMDDRVRELAVNMSMIANVDDPDLKVNIIQKPQVEDVTKHQ
tara:strand:+ start:1608 stop:1838 length:231 start_codon:yes stop_codon:yes gene_type:complete